MVDHNILKHLNIDKQAEYQQSIQQADENVKDQGKALNYSSMLTDLKKKKLPDLTNDNLPAPSFEEKRKLRENMFNFFEESTIEETRLVSVQEYGDNKYNVVLKGNGNRQSERD